MVTPAQPSPAQLSPAQPSPALLELATKVREDITITEKAPASAFSWLKVLNVKELVGAFNQEKALVGAVIVKTGCRTDGALHSTSLHPAAAIL